MSKLLRYIGIHDEVYLRPLDDLMVMHGEIVEVPDEVAGHPPTDDAASITDREHLTHNEIISAMTWGRGLLAQPANWELAELADGESVEKKVEPIDSATTDVTPAPSESPEEQSA